LSYEIFLPHARREDLGAAAGQRVEPGRAQLLEHLASVLP
jgi:hypothetical protein